MYVPASSISRSLRSNSFCREPRTIPNKYCYKVHEKGSATDEQRPRPSTTSDSLGNLYAPTRQRTAATFYKMGTVHGVYLKYVGISVMSYAGYSWLGSSGGDGSNSRLLMGNDSSESALQAIPGLILGYSAVLNGIVAAMFKMEWGMGMIGTYG